MPNPASQLYINRISAIRAIDFAASPSRLLVELVKNILFVFDTASMQYVVRENVELLAALERLRFPKRSILSTDRNVLVDAGAVVLFMAEIFEVPMDELQHTEPDPFMTAFITTLREALLTLLLLGEQIALYGRCFETVQQREATAEADRDVQPWCVLIGMASTGAVVDLQALLLRWQIPSFVTHTHNDGFILQFGMKEK